MSTESRHSGNQDRETRLVREYRERVRSFAVRWVGSADAEDVAQETLRRVLLATRDRRIRNGNERPAGFVFQTARHVCMHVHRSRRRRFRAIDRLPEEMRVGESGPDLFTRLELREQKDRVLARLESLPPADRELLLRLYMDDRATGEVASELGLSAGAVRVRKHRALRRLRSLIEEADGPMA